MIKSVDTNGQAGRGCQTAAEATYSEAGPYFSGTAKHPKAALKSGAAPGVGEGGFGALVPAVESLFKEA